MVGDNTILSLQSGRALISSWADAMKGKTLAPGVAYMSEKGNLTAKSNGKLDLQDIDQAWACVAANVVKKASEEFASHVSKGLSKDEAMERCSQSRFIAAKLHTVGYVSLLPSYVELHLTLFGVICRYSECSVEHVMNRRADRRSSFFLIYAVFMVSGRLKSRAPPS
jgi:hypothetical protein